MIFPHIDICFSLLPILVFALYWNKARNEIGILCVVLYSFLFFFINSLLTALGKIPLLYDLCTLMEFLLFTGFLNLQLESNTSKRILRLSRIVFTSFYVLFIIYTRGVARSLSIPINEVAIDSIPIGVETLIILPFSFYYLYERTKDTTTLFIYNMYQFWIILGIVLYLAGSFFIYIFSNYLPPEVVVRYWVITNIFSIVRSIFFTVAILYHVKPMKNRLVTDFEVTYLN